MEIQSDSIIIWGMEGSTEAEVGIRRAILQSNSDENGFLFVDGGYDSDQKCVSVRNPIDSNMQKRLVQQGRIKQLPFKSRYFPNASVLYISGEYLQLLGLDARAEEFKVSGPVFYKYVSESDGLKTLDAWARKLLSCSEGDFSCYFNAESGGNCEISSFLASAKAAGFAALKTARSPSIRYKCWVNICALSANTESSRDVFSFYTRFIAKEFPEVTWGQLFWDISAHVDLLILGLTKKSRSTIAIKFASDKVLFQAIEPIESRKNVVINYVKQLPPWSPLGSASPGKYDIESIEINSSDSAMMHRLIREAAAYFKDVAREIGDGFSLDVPKLLWTVHKYDLPQGPLLEWIGEDQLRSKPGNRRESGNRNQPRLQQSRKTGKQGF